MALGRDKNEGMLVRRRTIREISQAIAASTFSSSRVADSGMLVRVNRKREAGSRESRSLLHRRRSFFREIYETNAINTVEGVA